ncbi:winged helix-turn-helix domain-containing protein [Methanoplanus limicola]|uniref:Regulatory protein ArsR n=1 Tax=Methanoplanus limicola DSM 2279 TaxID=937775 RepID=H1YZC8_9EURY|nr:winged helix-turn-helix domain-containing protein [Methanoplanus limicola]EHQ35152.1 regulatory protein ArsR [Methanoplanus limicola DSM 2279]
MIIDEIILDSKKIGALSSSSRVQILKLLNMRNMTVTEIASTLNYSNSTVHQHLAQLVESGFVDKREDGHKWKYYSLSASGKAILNPAKKYNVFFVLSSLILFTVSIFSIVIYIKGFVVKSDFQPIMHEPLFFFIGELFLLVCIAFLVIFYRRKKYSQILKRYGL